MTKRLLLLRHAEAVRAAADDHGRALAPAGRGQAAAVGQVILSRGWRPDRAMVSDARRTRETFDGLRLEPAPSLDLTPALYNATPAAITKAVTGAGAASRLLVIGHNPGIALAARALAADGVADDLARLAGAFPTAALAVIRFDTDDWTALEAVRGRLEAFLWPDGSAAGA